MMSAVAPHPSTKMVDHALAHAALGLPVFPLSKNSKVPPKDMAWRQEATTDVEKIRRWWSVDPNYNIGVATGQVCHDGRRLVVVDVDVKGDRPGYSSFETLEVMGLPLDGMRVMTPSGGLHAYLLTDHAHRNSVDKLKDLPGIDIRGEGGYVVGSGSVINGAPYASNSRPIPTAPDWLDTLLINARPQHAERSEQPLVELDKSSNVANAVEYLKNRAPEAIEGAGGNDTTYRVAGRMRDYGLSEARAWEIMLDHWNEQKAAPMWEPEDLLTVVQNAYAYATGAWGGEDMTAYMEVVEGIDDYPVEGVGEDQVGPAQRGTLRTISAAKLAGVSVPKRAWYVPEFIPAGNVTLLYGDGGTGKSLAAIQLCVASVLGEPWLGLPTFAGPTLFLSAEDDMGEVHRRLAAILDSYDRTFDDVEDLHLVSLAGEDALLAVPDGRSNILKPTAVYKALDRAVAEIMPSLVVLDTLADLFGGDEIQRAQARQFIGLLRQLCIRHSTTVLLLAHPSLSGLNSGTGSSGSTAWNNSVRSRLYLRRVKDKDQPEANPDVRVLETQKANYGPVGNQLEIRWSRGVFIRHGHGDATVNAAGEQVRAEEVFLRLLDEYTAAGRTVSAGNAPNSAPAVFAASPKAEGVSKAGFKAAMERLFADEKIASAEFGSPSRRRNKLVRKA